MNELNICLFGRFRAARAEHNLDKLGTGKPGELFCYLLLNRHRTLTREVLVDILWPEYASAQSRKYLRQALWQLQSMLNFSDESANNSLLFVENQYVGINPDARFWLDVDVVEQAFERVRDVQGHDLSDEDAARLQAAAQLHHADLLVAWYHDWCLFDRERLRSIFMMLLDKLMGYFEARAEYETSIVYGNRILYEEPAHERTHRALMRLYYLRGDRTAALRQYEQCVLTLEQELGVRPTQRTVLLFDQIKADSVTIAAEHHPASATTLPLRNQTQSVTPITHLAST